MAYGYDQLKPSELLKVIEEIEDAEETVTYQSIANHLPKNPKTGKTFSREAIRLALKKFPEGRAIFSDVVRRKYVLSSKDKDRPPIIVLENADQFSTLDFEIVALKDITPQLVTGRDVYGDLPVSMASYAKSVYYIGGINANLYRATISSRSV